MNVKLHKNARTTPTIRKELQAYSSSISNQKLATIYNLHRNTIAKWRKRQNVADVSSCPKTIHTTLGIAQEQIAIALRKTLLLPLDDLLTVIREFINPKVSRSGLDRCLRRHRVSNLRQLRQSLDKIEPSAKHKSFKSYAPGFVHVDIKYLPKMQDEAKRRYLWVAIDRASRWVYVEIHDNKSAQTAKSFLEHLTDKASFKISYILTDNGKEFTDRFNINGERTPTGHHPFDRTCAVHNITHRLTKVRRPQTNGMVERFNGRIAEVLNSTHFDSSKTLNETITHYVNLYNHAIPQRALGHISPIEAVQQWQRSHPYLFKITEHNLTGRDR